MKHAVYSLFAALMAAGLGRAHMVMVDPAPFRSVHNPFVQNVDSDLTSPLRVYPCKGYLSDLGTPAGASVATWAAGSTQKMTISGHAAHGGGSCQASMSFDKGDTFKVIHSYIGNCPVDGDSSYSFTVPADSISGDAVFAWTWFNQIGNREMYMNCASITVTGGNGVGLGSLPDTFVANIPIAGTCSTVEGSDVLFPDPGEFVDNSSKKTSPPSGVCPAGHNYGGGRGNGGASVTGPVATAPTSTASDGMGDMGDMGSTTMATTTTGVVTAATVTTANHVTLNTTSSTSVVADYTSTITDTTMSTTIYFETGKATNSVASSTTETTSMSMYVVIPSLRLLSSFRFYSHLSHFTSENIQLAHKLGPIWSVSVVTLYNPPSTASFLAFVTFIVSPSLYFAG